MRIVNDIKKPVVLKKAFKLGERNTFIRNLNDIALEVWFSIEATL